MHHLHSFVNVKMDQSSSSSVPFNTHVEIRIVCRSKARGREFLIRNFGEAFYQDVVASSVPFMLPLIRRGWLVVIFTFY